MTFKGKAAAAVTSKNFQTKMFALEQKVAESKLAKTVRRPFGENVSLKDLVRHDSAILCTGYSIRNARAGAIPRN